MKTTMAAPRVAAVNGPRRATPQASAASLRTFTVTLDPEAADLLGDFCDEFSRLTPEATIAQVIADSMDSAQTDDSYRYSLSQDATERAMSGEPQVGGIGIRLHQARYSEIAAAAQAAGSTVDEYAGVILEAGLLKLAFDKLERQSETTRPRRQRISR